MGPVPPPNVEDPGVGDAGAGAVTVDAGPDDAGVCVPLVELSTPVGESTLPFWLVIGQGLAGLYFRPDGTAAYLCETLSDRCATLLLSAAWDVTGGVTVVEGPALGDSYPADVFFKPDGARLFLIGSGADRLYQFDLAVPWELGSAQAAGSVAFPLETAARSVFFRPDGGRVYLSGLASDRIFQYDLAIPWDVTSMEGANPVGSLSVVPSMVNPGVSDLHLDETGSTLHWSREGEGVYQAALSMPWDIESASAPVSVLVDTWMQGTSPRGLWVSNDHVYLLDPEGQRLRQLTRASCP